MSIRDNIDDLYRVYQLEHGAIPEMLIMNHYDYLSFKDEMGVDFLDEIDHYHGLQIRVEEESETRLESYATYEPRDDYYYD